MNNQPALANHQKAKRNRLANPKKRQTQQSTLSTDENAFPPQPPTSPDDIGNATNPQEPQTLSAQPPNNESTGNPTPRAMTKAGEAEATRIAKKATTSKEYFTQNPTPIDRLHRAINAPDESPKKPNNPVIWFDTDHKNQGNYE